MRQLTIFVMLLFSSVAQSAERPICRIAAISSPYITTLKAKELGKRSWIEKIAPAGLQATIRMANAVKPDAMVVLGSLTWSGSDADFQRIQEMLGKIQSPLYVVPGPKDLVDGDQRFVRHFGKHDVRGKAIHVKGAKLVFAHLAERTSQAQVRTLEQLETLKAGDDKACLLFSNLDFPPIPKVGSGSRSQKRYWEFIHKHKVAARFSGSHAHYVTYTDSLPVWSIPSSGWSYSPKWALALISVYKTKIELDLIKEPFQPVQRLVIPNPVSAKRMPKASADKYHSPTYTEDLKKQPKLTFVQLSDSQFDDGTVKRYHSRWAHADKMNELAVTQVNRLRPALAFMTGDLTNKNTPKEWQTFNRVYGRLKVPFYPVPGNHDTLYERGRVNRKILKDLFESGRKNWRLADKLAGGKAKDRMTLYRHFTKRKPYYSVEKNGCVFICLNTLVAAVDKEQMKWFRQELERTKKAKHVFVMAHYPVLNYFGGNIRGPEAGEILRLLRQYKVCAYLSGHRHRYGYRMHDGTAHVLCDCLCWGEYLSYQVYHVFDDRVIACWKPIFRADGNRPLYERVILPEPRYVPVRR